jgi:hypothetical protein
MALFNKDPSKETISFDKNKILKDILEMMEKSFPSYKVMPSRNDPWDFIIISTVEKKVVTKLGTMGMHESVLDDSFQEVVAVNVLPPNTELLSSLIDYSYGWTKHHVVVSDAKTLKRNLLNFKKG